MPSPVRKRDAAVGQVWRLKKTGYEVKINSIVKIDAIGETLVFYRNDKGIVKHFTITTLYSKYRRVS